VTDENGVGGDLKGKAVFVTSGLVGMVWRVSEWVEVCGLSFSWSWRDRLAKPSDDDIDFLAISKRKCDDNSFVLRLTYARITLMGFF
jgi:hypothetical protein